MMEEIIYAVQISNGSWDTYYTSILFCSKDLEYCETYIDKYNRILSKAKYMYTELYERIDDDLEYSDEDSTISYKFLSVIEKGEASLITLKLR